MSLLPAAATLEQYRAIPRTLASYDEALSELCRRHALPLEAPRTLYVTGSVPVFAVGAAHVVKLFAPPFAGEADIEARVLAHVQGRLGIPTPVLHASGVLEGWRYVVMGQLPGELLHTVWPRIPHEQQRALMQQVGAALARLHALPPLDVPPPGGSWAHFLAAQAATCVERQQGRGLAAHWLAQLPAFLEAQLPHLHTGAPVLLHTEVMREHLLVEQVAEDWNVSGLFDFEPAMRGHPDYELASVGVFLSCGEPALLRAVCEGYGRAGGTLPLEARRRALAFALLHRYSNLRWYLERVPPPAGVDTLEALADFWWATE